MWDIRDNKIDDYHIYGIISSNHRGIEVKPYKKTCVQSFQNSGGMVYIYSRENEKILRVFRGDLGNKISTFYNTGRLILYVGKIFNRNNIDSDNCRN